MAFPESLDYTDKDFDALRERVFTLIESVFPTWTDRNKTNFGNIMVDAFAFIGDVLTFYQDAQAGESRIITATQRRSVIALARLISYQLQGQTAATAAVTLELSRVPDGDVLIEAGTVLRTLDVTAPEKFLLLADVSVAAGTDPPEGEGTAEHSEAQQDITSATGLKDQQAILSFTPYLDESAAPSTTTQGTFTEVDNFLESGPNDAHFVVTVDQNDRATVRFGDGVNGAIPVGTITTDYKTGGGPDGNVEAGKIQIVEGTFNDSLGNNVRVTANNPADASGGAPRQSVDAAKVLAPASLRAPRTTVAREDYELNALRVGSVARALMLTNDQRPAVDENTGFLYVVPSGGGTPTQQLLDDVLAMVTVTFPNTVTFRTNVVAAPYKTIDVSTRVHLSQGSNPATVGQAIRASLDAFFDITLANGTANPLVDFGFNFKDVDGDPAGEVAWSNVLDAVNDTAGVRKIADTLDGFLLNGRDDDVDLDLNEFPILGTVTIIDAGTGNTL